MTETEEIASAIWNIRDRGCYDEADLMLKIIQQRAELLEVLSAVIGSVDNGQCAMLKTIAERVREAITRAEATE